MTQFNQPLNNWDVSHVHYINSMFENASSFNQNISNWNIYYNAIKYYFSKNCPIHGTSYSPISD